MDFDIIVIGSASMDVFVKTEARIVHIQGISHGHWVDEQLLAYPLGSKLLIDRPTGIFTVTVDEPDQPPVAPDRPSADRG